MDLSSSTRELQLLCVLVCYPACQQYYQLCRTCRLGLQSSDKLRMHAPMHAQLNLLYACNLCMPSVVGTSHKARTERHVHTSGMPCPQLLTPE